MIKKYLDFRTQRAAVDFLKGTGEDELKEYCLTPVQFGFWYFYDHADSRNELRLRNILSVLDVSQFVIYNED